MPAIPSRALERRTSVTTEGEVRLSVQELDVPLAGPAQVATGAVRANRPAPPAARRVMQPRTGTPLPVGSGGAGSFVAVGADSDCLIGRTLVGFNRCGSAVHKQVYIRRGPAWAPTELERVAAGLSNG